MNFKKYFSLCLISVASFISLMSVLFVAMAFYDNPLQVHPQGHFTTEKYYKDMRLQALGIIKNTDFDSVILGTSITENTSAMEASKLLGARFINLSLEGANFYERSIILETLLKHKKLNTIIYTIDQGYNKLSESSALLTQWELLYDNSPWNDLSVLYEKNILKNYFNSLLKKENPVYSDLTFFDRPQAWDKIAYSYVKFGGLDNWVKNIHQEQVHTFLTQKLPDAVAQISSPIPTIQHADKLKSTLAYIDKYLIFYIKQHPEIKFELIFPPYYRYQYAYMRQSSQEEYYIHQQVTQYLVNLSQQYKNIAVYGFEEEAFVDDIARYKDTRHYDEPVNSYMTQSIAQKKHLLTPQNIDAYLMRCEKRALDFDMVEFNAKVQHLITLQESKQKTP